MREMSSPVATATIIICGKETLASTDGTVFISLHEDDADQDGNYLMNEA